MRHTITIVIIFDVTIWDLAQVTSDVIQRCSTVQSLSSFRRSTRQAFRLLLDLVSTTRDPVEPFLNQSFLNQPIFESANF